MKLARPDHAMRSPRAPAHNQRRAKHVLLRLMTYVIGLSGGAIAGLIFSLLALIYLDARNESIFMKIVAAAILGGMLEPICAKLARRSIAA